MEVSSNPMEMVQDVQTILERLIHVQVLEQGGNVERYCCECIRPWVYLRAKSDNESSKQ